MKRRSFLGTTGLVAGGLAAGPAMQSGAAAEVTPNYGGLKHPKINLALRTVGRFFSGSLEEQFAMATKWGAVAYETVPKGDLATTKRLADKYGLSISVGGGTGSIGGGAMLVPEEHDGLVEKLKQAIEQGKQLDCKRYIALTGQERKDIPMKQQNAYVIEALKRLGDVAASNNVTIVVELLNTLVNHKGYFLSRTDHAVEIMEAVDNPRVKMLFDVYHQQITEGNVIRNLTSSINHIGHFHIADNPGRHEPGTGELNYTNILKAIAATGYDGYVATEFGPIDNSPEGKIKALNAVADCLDWA